MPLMRTIGSVHLRPPVEHPPARARSNGGVFGSVLSTPIINPPQSAILGMHATNMRPWVVNGQIVPRWVQRRGGD